MALRLNVPDQAPVTPVDPLSAIAGEAAAALRARDFAAFRAVFARAGESEPSDQRYRAQKAVIELGLSGGGGLGSTETAALFLALAACAVDALEAEPREPMLLNYGGIAFYELGELSAADALFRAAQRLDPDLPDVARNRDEVARRRRAGIGAMPGVSKRGVVALPELRRRAEGIASRAQPATGLKLSLCMIVRDEEAMLPRCLEAVAPAVDEIVIVDTGSQDRTIEIAESFGARVIEFPWTGSFSDARNVSFDAATGDWLCYLDADEVLVAEDVDLLRELTGRVWREAFYLVETNFTGELDDGTAVNHNALRVFRNRPEYRFEGRIHEQIAHRLPAEPERLELTRVRVEHYGYLGAVRDSKDKSRRNVELLERQIREGVNTPFLHFNLGSEHAALGDVEAALRELELAWQMLREDPHGSRYGYAPSLASRLTKAIRICGRLEEAHERADEALRIFPGFTDLVLEQAIAARERGDHATAIERLERCLEMGDAPSRYSATVGAGSYIALVTLAELRRARGELDQSVALLERCILEHPGYLGVVHPLASALLASGAGGEAVVAEIERRVSDVTPSVRFMLATALYEAAALDQAEAQYRAVIERQPSSGPARAALAECLLSGRRWIEAAAVAAEIDDQAAGAPATRRTELFARIMLGEEGETRVALARAATAGVAPAELALFAAWDLASRGQALPDGLPAAASPLAAAILEALLRVEEVDAFAGLLPVLERIAISARERSELLAAMYLRRGFLDSAADEWLAACDQSGPDAAALVGLAQVAYARELHEDALLLAEEARSLDPEHVGAQRIVARLAA